MQRLIKNYIFIKSAYVHDSGIGVLIMHDTQKVVNNLFKHRQKKTILANERILQLYFALECLECLESL